jgi:hypothetical protein
MSLTFILVFAVAAPFWALMVVAPKWGWTRRIASSPWIVAPPLAFWFVFALPNFGDVLPAVVNPRLADWQELLADPAMVTMVWGQVIAWDLFVGRWMYLDSRARDVHPLVMGPLLVLTILLSPIAVPLYLLLRSVLTRRTGTAAQAEAADSA